MRTKLFITTLAVIFVCSCKGRSGDVYICTGPQSHAYHKTPDCMGLNSCSGDVEKVSLKEAVEDGRHECGFCYSNN